MVFALINSEFTCNNTPGEIAQVFQLRYCSFLTTLYFPNSPIGKVGKVFTPGEIAQVLFIIKLKVNGIRCKI